MRDNYLAPYCKKEECKSCMDTICNCKCHKNDDESLKMLDEDIRGDLI